MKKTIILLSLIFLLTGCYDNIELNELAIISGIGIDYKDNEYYITYEILSDIKTEDNTAMLSYTINGSGKTISDAIIDANYKVSRKSYFAHLNILILSEEIINGHLDKITDYILRDNSIRSDFKVLVANNTTPEKILQSNNKNHPVVSEAIVKLIDNEKYNNNLVIGETFREITAKLISNNYDVILNTVSLENNNIAISNSYIFKNFNYQNTLTKQYSSLYNLLTKDIGAILFNKNYEKGNISITVNNSDSKIKVLKDKIIINTDLEAKILENNAKFNLKDTKSYEKLNNDFSKLIANDIKEFIRFLQENESDILGLQEKYYKSTGKENQKLWLSADIEVTVNLKINTKGFIFEVKE